MENPKRYGYRLAQDQIYQPLDCDTVEVRIDKKSHLTKMASALGTDYRVLKELNPHILSHQLPTGKYTLRVPPGAGARVAAFLQNKDGGGSVGIVEVSKGHYIVKPGDTLSHIARRTGVPIDILKRLNGINGSLVRVGERLQLAP